MNWVVHVLSVELKKAVSYRVDFWIQFLVGTVTDIAVAYFLWKAIFYAKGVTEMEGFTFTGIIYYYLFASFALKITRGNERGYLAQEIYDGGLTKYLLYPLPFLGFKYITHVSQQLLSVFQLLIALAVMFAWMGPPVGIHLTAANVVAGLLTCILCGYLHFVITSCVELVSFWQDVIWSLVVMLRFIVGLLGGAMIPIAFFPAWAQKAVAGTPFPLLISFPVKVFSGQINLQEWCINILLMIGWSLIFSYFLNLIWQRGTRQYTGVGI